MEIIFYLFAILFLIWEIYVFAYTQEAIDTLSNLSTEDKDGRDKALSISCFLLSYMIWAFVGLLTVQWPAFLLLFALGMIPKKGRPWLRKIDSFFSAWIIVFILINKFHLHWHFSDITTFLFN
jgi:hypothetical protein